MAAARTPAWARTLIERMDALEASLSAPAQPSAKSRARTAETDTFPERIRKARASGPVCTAHEGTCGLNNITDYQP